MVIKSWSPMVNNNTIKTIKLKKLLATAIQPTITPGLVVFYAAVIERNRDDVYVDDGWDIYIRSGWALDESFEYTMVHYKKDEPFEYTMVYYKDGNVIECAQSFVIEAGEEIAITSIADMFHKVKAPFAHLVFPLHYRLVQDE